MIDTLTRSRWIRTTTAAGLVPLLLVTSVPACALRSDTSSIPAEGWAPQAAQQRRPGGLGPRVVSDSQSAARTLSDWSRIEAVPVGTKTEVQTVRRRSAAGQPESHGPLSRGHGRHPHADARGPDCHFFEHAHPGKVGRAQRVCPSSDQEAIPGMEHSRGWHSNPHLELHQ